MQKNKITVSMLCQMAMLAALQIVLSRFCSIETMGIKLSFGFVPIMLCAYLFGPLCAGGVYALTDFIGAILFPVGQYHPGFTGTAFIMGIIYGLLLCDNGPAKVNFWIKAVLAVVINNLVLGLCVNTVWVSQLYGSKTYWGWFVYRLMEYMVMVPTQIVFVPILKRVALLIRRSRVLRGSVKNDI